jgi:ribosomal protein L34E
VIADWKRPTKAGRIRRCGYCGLQVHATRRGRVRCAERAREVARQLEVPETGLRSEDRTDYPYRFGRSA